MNKYKVGDLVLLRSILGDYDYDDYEGPKGKFIAEETAVRIDSCNNFKSLDYCSFGWNKGNHAEDRLYFCEKDIIDYAYITKTPLYKAIYGERNE